MKLLNNTQLVFPAFLFIILLAWSCRPSGSILRSDKRNIEGVWSEKWIGAETDVNYVDTVDIRFEGNKILITCLSDSNCIYDSVFLTKKKFQFRMQNTSNPKILFFVNYSLHITPNKDLLQGTIRNSNNQTDTVRFEREKISEQ